MEEEAEEEEEEEEEAVLVASAVPQLLHCLDRFVPVTCGYSDCANLGFGHLQLQKCMQKPWAEVQHS